NLSLNESHGPPVRWALLQLWWSLFGVFIRRTGVVTGRFYGPGVLGFGSLFGPDAVLPEEGQVLQLLLCRGGNFFVWTRFQSLENFLTVVPLLAGDVNIGEVHHVPFASRTEGDRFAHAVEGRIKAAALQFRQAQQVICLGKIGIPVAHGPQVLLHVGQRPFHWLATSLRCLEFRQGAVVVHPHILGIFLGRGIELFVYFLELLVLHINISERPMCSLIVDRVLRQGLQLLQTLRAKFGLTGHHFRHGSVPVVIGNLGDDYCHFSRPKGSGRTENLRPTDGFSGTVGFGLLGKQRSQRLEISLKSFF